MEDNNSQKRFSVTTDDDYPVARTYKKAFSGLETSSRGTEVSLPNFGADDEEDFSDATYNKFDVEELEDMNASFTRPKLKDQHNSVSSIKSSATLSQQDTVRNSRVLSTLSDVMSHVTTPEEEEEAKSILKRDMDLSIKNFSHDFLGLDDEPPELVYEVPVNKAKAFIQGAKELDYELTVEDAPPPIPPKKKAVVKVKDNKNPKKKQKKNKKKRKKKASKGISNNLNFCIIICFMGFISLLLVAAVLYLYSWDWVEDILGIDQNSTGTSNIPNLTSTGNLR